MNNNKKTNIIVIVISIIALVILMAFYPSLPDIIPVHWNMEGQVDGTGSKSTLFFLWGVLVVSNIIIGFAEKIDPKKESYQKFTKVFNIFRVIFALFMTGVLITNILLAIYPNMFNINNFMFPAMGVLFILMGNYMPKVKHNYTFGIKTPWTLADETVWNKTHRMAGPLWIVGGLLIVAIGLINNLGKILLPVLIMDFAVMTFVPMIYSFVLFKKQKRSE